jgi:hypothetical protein
MIIAGSLNEEIWDLVFLVLGLWSLVFELFGKPIQLSAASKGPRPKTKDLK